MSEQIEPMNEKEISVNDIEFAQIEQTGPKNLFSQMQGFWVTFATMFKKVNIQKLKNQPQNVSMAVIN
jgi:hypothetical protein